MGDPGYRRTTKEERRSRRTHGYTVRQIVQPGDTIRTKTDARYTVMPDGSWRRKEAM